MALQVYKTCRPLTMNKSHLAGLFLRRLYPASQTKSSLPRSFSKRYATQGSTAHNASTPSRKQVTVVNDDGRVQWGSLSRREKLARTTQQSFNLLTIFAGVIMTGGVITVLYLEVFSSESKTNHFNRAVNRVKKDGRCVDVLGPSKQIIAYGESTWSKWARARPIASKLTKDNFGTEHLVMHFNVEGPKAKGVVNLHMTKRSGEGDFQYKYLALDVKGHQRIYLENADSQSSSKRDKLKFLGVRWG